MPGITEAASWGAAAIAGIGAGIYAGAAAAARAGAGSTTVLEPGHRDDYERLYERYRQMWTATHS